MQAVVGVDLGGTNTKLILQDRAGRIIDRYRVPTRIGAPAETFGALISAIQRLLAKNAVAGKDVLGIGVGIPGPTNGAAGIAYTVPFLKWENTDIPSYFSADFSCPIYVENDGNVNVLGEWHFGAARGRRNVVMLTLGTGLGCGVICNGELLRGFSGLAGEAGHMLISSSGRLCACGKQGCFESFCCAKGLEYAARCGLPAYPDSCLQGTGGITARAIVAGHEAGDALCSAVFSDFVKYLAIGIGNLIKLFNPEQVLIGGGISHAGETLLAPLRLAVEQQLMHPAQLCPIDPGELYEDAGVMGSCSLVMSQCGQAR